MTKNCPVCGDTYDNYDEYGHTTDGHSIPIKHPESGRRKDVKWCIRKNPTDDRTFQVFYHEAVAQ